MTSSGRFGAGYRLPIIFDSAAVVTLLYLAVTILSTATIAKHTHFIAPVHLQPLEAAASFAVILCFVPLFLIAEFSFGYLVSLSMFGMVAAFIVMSFSTTREYDHGLARLSMIAALFAFVIPALFLKVRISLPALSPHVMDRVLYSLLALTFVVLALDSFYGYRFGRDIFEVQMMRAEIVRPRLLEYVNGFLLGAVLPFAFAYFALARRWTLAVIAALLPLAFFPMLLNKMVFFAPAWAAFLLVLFFCLRPKVAAALALLLPMVVGLIFFIISPAASGRVLYLINIRMFAIPAAALDYYSEFFSSRPLTYFCQINLVRAVTGCPYADQLGVIMQNEYRLGNFNASLFASEGIASLGWLAPIGTLFCGIVIGLANATAIRLSPVLVAVSSGVLVQTLMNVPLSTGLLTGGGALLFALWAIAPRGPISMA